MDLSSILLAYLAGVSARSMCLLAVALTVVWVGRVRSASARHAVWTLVAAGMLLLAALNPVLPPIPVRVLRAMPALPSMIALPDQPLDAAQAGGSPPAQPSAFTAWIPSWSQALLALYLAGALVFLARFLFGYLFTLRLVRAGRPVEREIPPCGAALLESSWISAPMTVGCIRPKVLLPVAWREWDQAKLDAVLAHELTHVRRADWLVAALARLNRSLFWFHPLAWWLERRLATLAEQACDDSALLVVGDRDQYASALLDMATAVKSARGRLVWHAIAMAEPAEVGSRIERILDETRPIPSGLSRSRRWAMVMCSLPLLYLASVFELAPPPALAQDAAVTESPYLRSLIAGMKLTAADVAAQERYLETNPEDLAARGRLIAYYFMNAVREPRLKHILWLIERHPESELAGFASAGISPRSGVLNDQADYERARSLWRRQTAQYSSDARVLGHAVQFYLQPGGDFDEAERLLKSARLLEPKQQAWTDQLSSLYVRVILGSAVGHGPGIPNGMANPAFAERVKSELETSTDAALVSSTASRLSSTARNLSQSPQLSSVTDLAERLTKRSEQLAGVRRIALAPSSPAAKQPPPPQVEATAVRPLPVDGPVQAAKLLKRVVPEYPDAAKQARIQGVVRLAITVGKDGNVIDIQAMGGHPLLAPAAMDAVRQFVYQPTWLNGQPVEVTSVVDVNFTLAQLPASPQRIRIGGNVQDTKIVEKVRPIYPSLAKQDRIEGVVRLSVTIGADGHVLDVVLLEGHPLLAAAAQEAVSQWVYRPTLLNGEPVEVITVVDVNFTLSD
jgi:TonB family protein